MINNQKTLNNSRKKRLSEIGRILANAIIRLEAKENQKTINKELDSNFYPSVHGVNDNLNRRR